MNTETFEKIITTQIDKCKSVLIGKAKEYADEGDRLHNFKIAAVLEGCTPVQALAGMMAKHTVSVYDLCRQNDNGVTSSPELWEEKITDSINYLLLLKVLLAEENKSVEIKGNVEAANFTKALTAATKDIAEATRRIAEEAMKIKSPADATDTDVGGTTRRCFECLHFGGGISSEPCKNCDKITKTNYQPK